MFVEEIAEASILQPDFDNPIDEDGRLSAVDIVEILSGLVTVQPELPESRVISDQRHILSIAHFSVKEYVLADRHFPTNDLGLPFDTEMAHCEILESCMAYIPYCYLSLRHKTDSPVSLLSYACKSWPVHAALASAQASHRVVRVVSRLTMLPSVCSFWMQNSFPCWPVSLLPAICLYGPDSHRERPGDVIREEDPALYRNMEADFMRFYLAYLAVTYGLVAVAENLLNIVPDREARYQRLVQQGVLSDYTPQIQLLDKINNSHATYESPEQETRILRCRTLSTKHAVIAASFCTSHFLKLFAFSWAVYDKYGFAEFLASSEFCTSSQIADSLVSQITGRKHIGATEEGSSFFNLGLFTRLGFYFESQYVMGHSQLRLRYGLYDLTSSFVRRRGIDEYLRRLNMTLKKHVPASSNKRLQEELRQEKYQRDVKLFDGFMGQILNISWYDNSIRVDARRWDECQIIHLLGSSLTRSDIQTSERPLAVTMDFHSIVLVLKKCSVPCRSGTALPMVGWGVCDTMNVQKTDFRVYLLRTLNTELLVFWFRPGSLTKSVSETFSDGRGRRWRRRAGLGQHGSIWLPRSKRVTQSV